MNNIIASMNYSNARAEKRAAYERYNYASAALELATIKERFAEIYSQHAPISEIDDLTISHRDKLCASAYYIMYGRLPRESIEEPKEK